MTTHTLLPTLTRPEKSWGPAAALLLTIVFACPVAIAADSPAPLLTKAQQALNQHDPRRAKIHLKNLLKKQPSNVEARTLLGTIYFFEKDYAGAAKELKIAIRLGSENPDLLLMLSRAYLEQGEVDDILEQITIPKGASDKFAASVISVRGQAFGMKGDGEQAQSLFEEAHALDPEAADPIAGLAQIMLAQQRLDEALDLAGQAITRQDNNQQAWLVKAEALRLQKQFDPAAKAYDKVLELTPTHIGARVGRATLAIRKADFSSAEKDIDKALEISPNYLPARYLKALMAYQKKDLEGAATILQTLLLHHNEHLPSQLLLGTILYQQQRYEQAKEYLSSYTQRAPNQLNAKKMLASLLIKTNDAPAAIELLTPFIQDHTSDPQLLSLAGTAYTRSGNTDKGEQLLAKAAELAPGTAAIHTQLALSQLVGGNTDAAVGQLETAAELGMPQADFLLVLTYIKQKQHDKAVQTAQALIDKLPDNPSPYNLLGAALAGKGDLDGATRAFAKAQQIAPDKTAARFNLAKIDLRNGKRKQAIERLDALLAQHPDHLGSATTRAGLALQDGDQALAGKILTQAYERNRDSIKAGLVLARYFQQTKQPMDALRVARELSTNHPKSTQAKRALANALSATGDQRGAAQAYRAVLQQQPDSLTDRLQLALIQLQTKRAQKAAANLQQILDKAPDNYPAMAAMASAQTQLKHYSKATALARQLQQQLPDAAIGYRLEADIIAAIGNPQDAAALYQQAVDKNPSQQNYQRLIAVLAKGNAAALEQALTAWLKQHPSDIRPAMRLAANAERRGDAKAALKYYQHVIQNHPKQPSALNNAAWLLMQSNDRSAVDLAARAYQIAPDNLNIADTYGMVLVNMGDPEKGLSILQRTASRAPHKPDFSYHVALGLYQVGRHRDAIKRLRRILGKSDVFNEREAAEKTLKSWQAKT